MRVSKAFLVEVGFFFGLDSPIKRTSEQTAPGEGGTGFGSGIQRTGFEQEDVKLTEFTQTGCYDATGCASAHYDVIGYQLFSLRRSRPERRETRGKLVIR